ncbi:MAG: Glycosyltransferase, AglL family [Candidatus Methanohalarchaeum thermophilum]|uniref:Glycosyltransferase, AglL family n=1 Tax=Methanohalarchaeum thermophilum TaxID=1903181 RepID=A0A1Q6DSP1_METT1|nr:MAG: Glycosyltransferase, AglL family [Candidatus Methanohalarchaeum thermophilum]
MKILQTPIRFYPYTGGVENHVYDLSKKLIQLGNDVSVICSREPRDLKKKEEIDGIKVNRLRYYGKIANTNITPSLPLKLLKENFDLIHTHLPTPWNANWSSIISRLKNKPLVLTYHNDIVGEGINDYIAKYYNKTFLKTLLSNSDKIIITQPSYLNYSPYLKPFEDKVEVIPNGVDVNRFTPKYGEGEGIFFLGVLDEYHRYKGLDVLLKAFKKVSSKIDTELIIGGSGELLKEYKDLAKELNIENKVNFVGYIPERDLPRYYRKSNLFVLPSISSEQEGFGMVLLEAMASGLPVITTDVAGVSDEIKNNVYGKVIQPNNIEKLAKAITSILRNKEKKRKMGKRGRKLVEERFNWKKIAKKTNELYKEVL